MSGLVHLRLRAGATSKVRITTDRCKVGSSSGEVVVGNAVSAMVGVAVAVIRAVAGASRIGVAMSTTRLEGCTRKTTVRTRDCFVVSTSRLPVDRVHPLVKFGGATELPLAEDSP